MLESARIFDEIVNERRAVRKFHPSDYDPEAVTRSLQRSRLAPSSSNMQLYELYRVSDPEKLNLLSHYCMDQNTTSTAKEMVVVVARPDLWKRRAKSNYDFVAAHYANRESHKGMSTLTYFKKLMPLLYNNDIFGIRGALKKIFVQLVALRRPMVRQVNGTDMRIVVHKSAALVAQTFMLSMTAEGHDTCPVEGFDSLRVKKLLGLPRRAEINMIITCGKKVPEGIYGERFRVPESEVIFKV